MAQHRTRRARNNKNGFSFYLFWQSNKNPPEAAARAQDDKAKGVCENAEHEASSDDSDKHDDDDEDEDVDGSVEDDLGPDVDDKKSRVGEDEAKRNNKSNGTSESDSDDDDESGASKKKKSKCGKATLVKAKICNKSPVAAGNKGNKR